jgi:hypothetical protein
MVDFQPMPETPAGKIRALYALPGADPDLAAFLRALGGCSQTDLADLIEADGRCRIEASLAVSLERYLGAIPDLVCNADALDAAIDMALRALSGSGKPTEDAVRTLSAQYPALSGAIRDAAQLGLAMFSTSAVRPDDPSGPLSPPLPTPCDFGPRDARGVPRYLLRRFLGAGASGLVYEAIDRALSEADHEALIAIKILRNHSSHPRARDAFFEEATKVRRISHPGVVRVQDCGIADSGDPYLVYEFLPNGDLQQFLASQPGPVQARQAAELVARIARGVHAAHAAGLIHCDIKPSNVLLDESGQPKVADFGIAVRLGHDAPPGSPDSPSPYSTRPGGNLAFMSPEQYRLDAAAFSTASDIYALGGLLFYLLTRRSPNGATPAEVDQTHDPLRGRREAISLRSLRADVPTDVDAICRRALSPRSEHRHESAAALADDLERWLGRRPIAWMRPSVLKVAALWVRRRPAIALLVLTLTIAVAAGVGIGAYLWYLATDRKVQNAMLALDVGRKEDQAANASFAAAVGQESRNHMRSIVGALRNVMKPELLCDVDAAVLQETYFVEWLFGPRILGDPDQVVAMWAKRIDVARSMVGRASGSGGEESSAAPAHGASDLNTLLWESTLGLWLTLDGDPAEASAVLDRNRAKWAAILQPADPWLTRLDAIRAAASARSLLRDPSSGTDPSARSTALRETAADLRRRADDLHAASGNTNIHLLLLWTLRDLYDPARLNDSAEIKRLSAELKTYGDLAKARPTKPDRASGTYGAGLLPEPPGPSSVETTATGPVSTGRPH